MNLLNQRVVMRSEYSGVHIGTVREISPDQTKVLLVGTKRIFKWNGAKEVLEIANQGVSNDSQISCGVPYKLVYDVCEIHTVTKDGVWDKFRKIGWGSLNGKDFQYPEEDEAEFGHGQYVLVRGPYSGVCMGKLEEFGKDTNFVVLTESVRLHGWTVSSTVDEVCMDGIGEKSNITKVSLPGHEQMITDVIELLPVTPKAVRSILAQAGAQQ